MDLLTIALVVFLVSVSLALVTVTWYLGSLRAALLVGGAILFQGLHIGAFIFVDFGELWRASLLVVHPVGTISGVALGATLHFLFYEVDLDDLYILDADGETTGHVEIPTERRENAELLGGDELPTRRGWGTTDTVYYCRDPIFREDEPDIYGVPPEKSLPDDEAMTHNRKVHEMHDKLEEDSMALDHLELSLSGMLKRAYRKGTAHGMIAQENLSEAGDLSISVHEWIQDKKAEVQEAVEEYRDSTGDDAQEVEEDDEDNDDETEEEENDGE